MVSHTHNTIEEYLSTLNPEQTEAVLHKGPSLLILAGAGSGKTRVITTKIAYLIAKEHIDPASILAVTFTKKAANEMRERAVAIEPKATYAQLRTFHSWGAWFLRFYADEAGISKNFTVYDDEDMVTLVGKAIPSITRKEAMSIAHKISLAKDYAITPDSTDFSRAEEAGLYELSDEVFLLQYKEYQKKLRSTGNVDFGDLILLPYLVLKENSDIKDRVHKRHRVIMVDEYQDSNVSQFLLLQELSGANDANASNVRVCVVGDDDQSIYKFRGAEVQNILRFKDVFPNTDIIKLETNYRSTPQILNCADNVISNNAGRMGKALRAVAKEGKMPTLVFLPNQDDECEFCADLIESQHQKGEDFSDWAILYRTNAQSLGFETTFLHRQIPYTIVGSFRFYEREEIKDALSWLRFIANPKDEIAFRRIINKPARGIGTVSQDKIVNSGYDSILEACKNAPLSKKAKENLKNFATLIEVFSLMIPDAPTQSENSIMAEVASTPSDMSLSKDEILTEAYSTEKKKLSAFVEKVIKDSGLEEFHKAQDEISGSQKIENLNELINSALLYPLTRQGLLDFLDSISLEKSLEEKSSASSTDRVTLITLHNTKGLEFKKVIITGMEAGIFPREDKVGEEIEEERRLFYVGITRARAELYFTSCGIRRLFGRTNYMTPSPFLSEIDEENIRIIGDRPLSFVSHDQKEEEAAHPLSKEWSKGKTVYHDDWGHGEIIDTQTTEEGEYVISVRFETGGIKKFLPQYQSHSLTIEEPL